MRAVLTLHRRIEWLLLFSFALIIAAELIILWSISGTPAANPLRYLIVTGAILISLVLVRQRIIKPIRQMTQASLRIAEGNYHNRLPAYGSVELDELARTFNQMAAYLEDVEAQRVALIGNVAHELRTPLNNIRMTMEGLIDEVFAPDTETFLQIQHEVSRLQRLVVQLEQLSQAESGQIPLHLQTVNYGQLVTDVCERMEVQYDSKGVVLALECSDPLPLLSVDPDHITQVLVNLLGNALQYTPPAGRVNVQITAGSGTITTRIADTGIGIQPDDLSRIFERFYRADKSRSRSSGGNGIGLTIARQLVLAHGGTIGAESAGVGRGSVFTFTLPVDPRPSSERSDSEVP